MTTPEPDRQARDLAEQIIHASAGDSKRIDEAAALIWVAVLAERRRCAAIAREYDIRDWKSPARMIATRIAEKIESGA